MEQVGVSVEAGLILECCRKSILRTFTRIGPVLRGAKAKHVGTTRVNLKWTSSGCRSLADNLTNAQLHSTPNHATRNFARPESK